MSRQRLWLLFIALVLIVLSWVSIASARVGLEVRSLEQDGIPLLYLAPQRATSVPGVLVAHGYTGSKQLMLGYGHALAHAGYAAMLWDFDGHGANPTPIQRPELQENLDTALKALLKQPEVDPTRLALVGHSMGSGVVMQAGIQNPQQFAATVAISPTSASVTPQRPRNLQMQAGVWENRFVENAKGLLTKAGGANTNLTTGRGRELVTVPNAEHITILFNDVSHQATVRWLNATFNRESNRSYTDRRMGWYGLHLVGWLVLLAALAPFVTRPIPIAPTKRWRLKSWLGLLLSPLTATAGLYVLNQVLDVQDLGGIQVGGSVSLWFLIGGLTWLGLLSKIPRISWRRFWLGLALFSFLWVAFGAMAQLVWLQWWLIPQRLLLWLPLGIACLPWFLASEMAQQQTKLGGRILWYLGQSAIVISGFVLTLQTLPNLGFIFLLMPLFPLFFAIFSFVASQLKDVWIYAIGVSLFFGWVLAAGFPLVS